MRVGLLCILVLSASAVDLYGLSAQDVTGWLRGLSPRYAGYAEKFKEEGINGQELGLLDQSFLEQELGVTNRLHRRTILEARDALKVAKTLEKVVVKPGRKLQTSHGAEKSSTCVLTRVETADANIATLTTATTTAEGNIVTETARVAAVEAWDVPGLNTWATQLSSCLETTSTGNYWISPGRLGMASKLNVTCVHEGQTIWTEVSPARGWEHMTGLVSAAYGNVRPQTYGDNTNVAQWGALRALTTMATYCEQYLNYRCQGSLLHGQADWMSADGTRQSVWSSGAPLTDAAGAATDACEQNVNTVIANEGGTLMDKDKLPVRELRFGDVDAAAEFGEYTLGAMRCR